MKRMANENSESWDDEIQNQSLCACLQRVYDELTKRDPVCGKWAVRGESARVWVDASNLALAAAIEVNGEIVEDGSWLRKDNVQHINMAELESVIKGLNLALVWQLREIELMTDSKTVFRWVSDLLTDKARLQTKAAGEMLVRRRLDIVKSLMEEYQLKLSVQLVHSEENKADRLTRVPRGWLEHGAGGERMKAEVLCLAAAITTPEDTIRKIHHEMGHPGVRRTLYFVKKYGCCANRRDVKNVVSACDVCGSIDPPAVKWNRGSLSVEKVWDRLAIDITHFRGKSYLTLIDCGPSRFALWRELRSHCVEDVTGVLKTVFFDRGPPTSILTDNETSFRSLRFTQFLKEWGVRLRFRCAYAPSGNGIIERNHRSVKVIAARKQCSVAEAVYLYNVTPMDDESPDITPASLLYRYEVRTKYIDGMAESEEVEVPSKYRVGDLVWVRPPDARCTDKYLEGVVTDVVSAQCVEVDGMYRHIRDLRRRSASVTERIPARQTEGEDTEALVLRFPEVRENSFQEAAGQEGDGVELLDADLLQNGGGVQLRRSLRLQERVGGARPCHLHDCYNQEEV